MRKHGERQRLFAPLIVLVVLGGTTVGEARNLSPSATETGYPRELINRPVCWAGPMPDEAMRCGATHPQRQGRKAFD